MFFASRVFWLFLWQVLGADRSCRDAVRRFLAWRSATGRSPASSNTAAYCKARARLREADLVRVGDRVAQRLDEGARAHWGGRRVKVVDGTGLSMPDTPENQALYPQSRRQKPGCGFPAMKVVALFSLATGAMLGLAKGCLDVSERALFRRLWPLLEPGDVVLADRGFAGFATFLLLARRGVHCVMRNHPRRRVGVSLVRRLRKGDRLVQWHRGGSRPKWIDHETWRAMPRRLDVREIDVHIDIRGFRCRSLRVVTNLLDPEAFPGEAITDLYRRRWTAELFLRDIKTTLGMDALRCKRPEMVHRELLIYRVAYNLIRTLMVRAAHARDTPIDRISFKGTVAAARQWAACLAAAGLPPRQRRRCVRELLLCIASDILPHRPDRTEPRAVKRRPKNYQRLTKPRQRFTESPHRNHYRKPLS